MKGDGFAVLATPRTRQPYMKFPIRTGLNRESVEQGPSKKPGQANQ